MRWKGFLIEKLHGFLCSYGREIAVQRQFDAPLPLSFLYLDETEENVKVSDRVLPHMWKWRFQIVAAYAKWITNWLVTLYSTVWFALFLLHIYQLTVTDFGAGLVIMNGKPAHECISIWRQLPFGAF